MSHPSVIFEGTDAAGKTTLIETFDTPNTSCRFEIWVTKSLAIEGKPTLNT